MLIGSSDEEFLTIKVKIFTEGAKGGVGGPMGQSGEIGTRGSGGGGAGSYNGSTSLFGSRGGHGFVEIVW
ncbi:hypothetical protein ACH434_09990 [Lysinibacillus fusiformis]|uniref:hypothetical protein n=1 Tax=Lysinibacillus fusiformis TaxID=28031 RepID=UPI0037B0F4EF